MNLEQQLSNAAFYTSASDPDSLPGDQGSEIAFAGRSNAGKSSAINRICTQKSLARTSKTPGRTQLINFFTISPDHKLVDLPGYGYAKASQGKQRQWIELLEFYFTQRKALHGTMIVMDIRHPFQAADQTMVEWCLYHHCEVHILLNKSDKLSRNQISRQLQLTQERLADYDQKLVSVQPFSAMTGAGLDQVFEKLSAWFDR